MCLNERSDLPGPIEVFINCYSDFDFAFNSLIESKTRIVVDHIT